MFISTGNIIKHVLGNRLSLQMTGDFFFCPYQRGGALINTAMTKVSANYAKLKGIVCINMLLLCFYYLSDYTQASIFSSEFFFFNYAFR